MAECFQLPTISFCYSDSSVIDMKLMDLDIEPRYIAGPWEGLKSGGGRGGGTCSNRRSFNGTIFAFILAKIYRLNPPIPVPTDLHCSNTLQLVLQFVA